MPKQDHIARGEHAPPEAAAVGDALLKLVRLLAREAARETWSASVLKDSQHHDQDDQR